MLDLWVWAYSIGFVGVWVAIAEGGGIVGFWGAIAEGVEPAAEGVEPARGR